MLIRAYADRRRVMRPQDDTHVFERLRHDSKGDLPASTGLPRAWIEGISTFYDALHSPAKAPHHCQGTACVFAGGLVGSGAVATPCLGRCYEAPARSERAASGIPRTSMASEPIVLRHLLANPPAPWSDYDLPEGPAILSAVLSSGLRGRGGAAFPTGRKWETARVTAATERYVVCNGDEGDPGSYVDRLLLEEAPHAVLAGMVACARAIGATHGVVFIRDEYPEAPRRVLAAIHEAEERGVLGNFEIRVIRGAGSYVAGEETALLRAIEGFRAEPQPKPPYPAEVGLYGKPTVVQNVETLAVVPWVVRNGRRGETKALSLSGALRRRGVVEIALGTPLREVLEVAGGGQPDGRRWKMALVGGPMGRLVPERDFDTPLSFDGLPGMGHGGIVVLDETVTARALAEHLYSFASRESCGNCAPCRLGTRQLAQCADEPALLRLLDTLEMGSLCGFGQGVPRPLRDLLRAYPGELFP